MTFSFGKPGRAFNKLSGQDSGHGVLSEPGAEAGRADPKFLGPDFSRVGIAVVWVKDGFEIIRAEKCSAVQ